MTTTDAYTNLAANLDDLLAMQKPLMPVSVQRAAAAAKKCIGRQLRKESTSRNYKLMLRVVSNLSSLVDDYLDYLRGRALLQDWISVVLVTLVLGYLEDGLVFVATKNPNLLKNADPLSNDQLIHAASIEDVLGALRRQWANRTLLGGPEKWLSSLRNMGAKKYKKEYAFRLQHLWDTRNLIVHGRGIATTEYLRKYKDPTLNPGSRVRVSTKILTWWVEAIQDFVDSTDPFFVNYGAKTSRA